MSLDICKVALVTDPAEITRRFQSILIFGQGMDVNAYRSLRGIINKDYHTNISCYSTVIVCTEIKLKGDKDIKVKGTKEKEATSFRDG